MLYEPVFDAVNQIFLRQTQERYVNSGEVCNMYQWLQFYTYDVIGELVYSRRHGFLETNHDIEGIVKANSALFDYAAVVRTIYYCQAQPNCNKDRSDADTGSILEKKSA